MTLYQKILMGIIGVFALPTIALGSSFTVSLIQGKTVEEAVQILAEQIDYLTGRVEIVETKQTEMETEHAEVKTKQTEQEQTISELQSHLAKEKACREADKLLIQIKETCGIFSFPGIDECIARRRQFYSENHLQKEIDRANIMLELKPLYLSAKAECEK